MNSGIWEIRNAKFKRICNICVSGFCWVLYLKSINIAEEEHDKLLVFSDACIFTFL
jgi:hypothetical protein